MQGRMRGILILSLALVLLVSVAYAAPSLVDASEAAETSQGDGEKTASDEKEDLQLQLAGKSDDDDEPEINRQEVAKEFRLTEAELEELYLAWVAKAPAGDDTSFPAFINWMKDNDEPEDEGDLKIGTRFFRPAWRWVVRVANGIRKFKKHRSRSLDGEEAQMDGTEIAAAETRQGDEEKTASDEKEDLQLQLAGKSDDDDDDTEIDHQDAAKEFGLTETELEELYNTWVPTVPAGEDSSFQAYLDWMDANDEPEDEGVVGPGTQYLKSIIKWTGKIRNKANKKGKAQRSIDGEEPQMENSQIAAEYGLTKSELEDLYEMWVPKVLDGDDSSFQAFLIWMKENDGPADDEDPTVGTHYLRSIVKWTRKVVGWIARNNQRQPTRRPRTIDDEQPQPQINKDQIAAGFGLTEADLEDLYQIWIQKTPAGEDGSFQAFVQWMKENYEPEDDGAVRAGTQSWNKFIKWGSGPNWFRKKSKKDNIADEQQLTEVQRSVDDEQSEINEQEIATPDKRRVRRPRPILRPWPRPRPRPRELDEDQQQSIVNADKRRFRRLRLRPRPILWPILRPRELDEDQQQSIVNGQESMTGRDLQPSFKPAPKSLSDEDAGLSKENVEDQSDQQGSVATEFGLTEAELEELYEMWVTKVPAGEDSSFQAFFKWMDENDEPEDDEAAAVEPATVDKRSFATFWKKFKKMFARKKPRGLDEDQQQSVVNGNEERELPKENAEDKSLGVNAAAYSGQNLFGAYRKWLKTVGEGKDRTFQKFAELFNIRKPRSLESKPSDESSPTDKEKPDGEEKEKEVPVEKSEPKDTNGGYSCEKNSPCNIENIVNEQFYFATASTAQFIQCDAWGGCHTLTCDDGLVWDDQIKTCGLRT